MFFAYDKYVRSSSFSDVYTFSFNQKEYFFSGQQNKVVAIRLQ